MRPRVWCGVANETFGCIEQCRAYAGKTTIVQHRDVGMCTPTGNRRNALHLSVRHIDSKNRSAALLICRDDEPFTVIAPRLHVWPSVPVLSQSALTAAGNIDQNKLRAYGELRRTDTANNCERPA